MIVYYRLCSIPSTNPSPILQEDKFELNKLCLKSFVKTFENVKPEVVFLADFCGQREEEMVEQICTFKHSFIPTSLGINETALLQWEMASKQDKDDIILFLECDYLWNPNISDLAVRFKEAIQTLGLVSPYDHPNFYRMPQLHSNKCEIELVGDHHFRSTERNTLTFGIRRDVLKENLDIFNKYGYLDGDTWYEIKDRGQNLYVPVPSFATHMVVDNLAPSVDWRETHLWRLITEGK